MRKLFKKSIACVLAAILCVSLCVCAIPASAEAITFSTNAVSAKAGDAVTINFEIADFAAVKAAQIKLVLPEAIASIDSVSLNGDALVATEDVFEIGEGYIKLQALFGDSEYDDFAAADSLVLSIAATVADVEAGTYAYGDAVVNLYSETAALDVDGAFGEFKVVEEAAEIETFDAQFRYIVVVNNVVGTNIVFTKPADFDDFKITINRKAFNTQYNYVDAEEVVFTPDDAYLTSGAMYGFEYFDIGLYELSIDATMVVEGYKDGKLVAVSNPVTLNLADLIVEKIGTAAEKDKGIYSEILWLGDAALAYFQKAAGAADIDELESPAKNNPVAAVEGFTPVEGEAVKSSAGTVDFYRLRPIIGISPSIQYMMSGISDAIRADASYVATHESGLLGEVPVEAALATATDNMMIAGAANAYTHDQIALYDSNKIITAKVVDSEGNELASIQTSLAIEIATALEGATEETIVNLYTRLLTFGEYASTYFNA